jgi:hypothetical protein
MKEHIELLTERQFPIPTPNLDPVVIIRNERKAA